MTLTRRIVPAGVFAVSVNALILFAIGAMNRAHAPAPAAPYRARLRVSDLAPPPPPEREPLSAEPAREPVARQETVNIDMPSPSVEPLDLPALMPEATIRVAFAAPPPSLPVADRSDPAREGDVDEPPRPVRDPRPDYPRQAARLGIEGHVTIEILVGAKGEVLDLRTVDRSGPASFERAAAEAIRNGWVFESGRHRGRPVPVWVERRIEFRMIR